MATSGNTILQLSRDDLIKAALRTLSVLAQGQTPTTEDYNNASQALNMVMAYLRTKGLPLWSRREYSFAPVASTISYNIGVGQTLNTPYPTHLLQAYRVDSGNTTKIPVQIVANHEFNQYPSNSGGLPIQLNYQPLINYGTIKLWPTPDSSATTSTITLVYTRPLEYFDSSVNTMDLPEEWYLPVVYQLARVLAPQWSIPIEDRKALAIEAKEYLDQVEGAGFEDGSVFFQPQRRQ